MITDRTEKHADFVTWAQTHFADYVWKPVVFTMGVKHYFIITMMLGKEVLT